MEWEETIDNIIGFAKTVVVLGTLTWLIMFLIRAS